jgi:TRAP-type C4-dicarboxylate transport system permease small subunit
MSGSDREERIAHAFELADEAKEEQWRLRNFSLEDAIVFFVFWILALDIFVQFFTRYVLNDSLAWTEEIARYLLITTGFLGSVMAVRKNTHIMVEFLYRYIPGLMAKILSSLIDLSRIGFFAMLAWVSFKVAGKTKQMMVSIDVPKSIMYYMIAVCFAFMALRAVQVAVRHWRQGGSDMALRCIARQRRLDEEAAP